MNGEPEPTPATFGENRRSRRVRSRRVRRRAGGAVAAAAAAGTVAALVPMSPAAADGPYWTQVQHNIQGGAGVHVGNQRKAQWVRQEIQRLLPVAASVNEVCRNQADYLWNHVSNKYAMWFVVAKEDEPDCNYGDFGNVLLVHKDVSPVHDATWGGYRPRGNPRNSDTHIFVNGTSSEHKRIDCALVTGSNATQKWRACTTHLVSSNSGSPSAQMSEIRNASHLAAPSMFMGDFNLTGSYMSSNANNWRWDTTHTLNYTHSSGKLDWVLGRTDYDFQRNHDSVVEAKGADGYNSDHNLLVAYLRAV